MNAIVGAALRQRILVVILAVLLIGGGLFAYKRLNIEAYPDPVPPLVERHPWRRFLERFKVAARWRELVYGLALLPIGLLTTLGFGLAFAIGTLD